MGRICFFSLHSCIFLIDCSPTYPQPPCHQTKQSQCLFSHPTRSLCSWSTSFLNFCANCWPELFTKVLPALHRRLRTHHGHPKQKSHLCNPTWDLLPPSKAFSYCYIQFVIYFSRSFMPYCFPSTHLLSVRKLLAHLGYSCEVNIQRPYSTITPRVAHVGSFLSA